MEANWVDLVSPLLPVNNCGRIAIASALTCSRGDGPEVPQNEFTSRRQHYNNKPTSSCLVEERQGVLRYPVT